MKKSIYSLLLFLFIQMGFVLHPVNMSVSDVTYKEKKLHLKIKFFTDDFQAALNSFFKTNIDLVNNKIGPNEEKLILSYINSKLQIEINNALIKWQFQKIYYKEAVVYIEYNYVWADINKIKFIKTQNTFLFDDFPEQKNIMNFHLFDDIKVLNFDNEVDQNYNEIRY